MISSLLLSAILAALPVEPPTPLSQDSPAGVQEIERRYADGTLRERGRLRDGKREGTWTTWHDNGVKASEASYSSDLFDGFLISWYANGQQAATGLYRRGRAEGRWWYWNADGTPNPDRSGFYERGVRVGREDGSPRDRLWMKQWKRARTFPGWELYETEHYLVLTNVEDADFVAGLKHHLEAMHTILRQDFPPARADERSEDPFVGVVRVFRNLDQYHEWGGPLSSSGHFSPTDNEAVAYDDQAGGGRRNTWATLYGMLFHQWFHYAYEGRTAHVWFSAGQADFYSGYRLKDDTLVLRPFDWRLSTVRAMIRDRKYAPIQRFLRFTQAEYHGANELGLSGGELFAQGWSLIWFLRTGSGRAVGWNPAWDAILPDYLRTLVERGDRAAALNRALMGVDTGELEDAWQVYTKKGF